MSGEYFHPSPTLLETNKRPWPGTKRSDGLWRSVGRGLCRQGPDFFVIYFNICLYYTP